jgi:hypothetical protein
MKNLRMLQARHALFTGNRLLLNWTFANGFYLRIGMELK